MTMAGYPPTQHGVIGPGPQGGVIGMPQMPRVPFGQNQVLTALGTSLLAGRGTLSGAAPYLAQTLPAAMQGNQQFREALVKKQEDEARRAKMNEVMKAWPGLSQEQRALFSAQPELFGQYAVETMKPGDPKDGLMTVGERIYDPKGGKWIEPPGGAASGPYDGKSMDGQNWNIVLNPNADPASPEYAAAYTQLFAPRNIPSMDAAGNQVIVPITPAVPPGVRPPAGMGGAAPAAPTQTVPKPTTAPPANPVTPGQQSIGEPVVIGKPKPSDAQLTTALFADRMTKANQIITEKEDSGTSYSDRALSNVPLGIGNYLVSDDYRLLEQAQRDFINAVLRRESGAVIAETEFENARKQYFPQPGDEEADIRQKRAARQTAIDGMKRAAGSTYESPEIVTPPADGVPAGVDPEIWKHMTPEEQSLWRQ